MSAYTLRVLTAEGGLIDTFGPYTREGSKEQAAYEVNHWDDAARVEIVDDESGKVVEIVRPRVTR